MDQHLTPPPAMASRTHWTPAKQRRFLVALLETVATAARSVGMSPTSAHRLRRRLAGTMFDQSWDWALAHYAQCMADPFAPDPPPPAAPLKRLWGLRTRHQNRPL